MIYKSLAAFDSTADQDLALTIQFTEDTQSPAQSADDYAALIFASILDGYVECHIVAVQRQRVADALRVADPTALAAVSAALHVDLVITAPVDVGPPLPVVLVKP